MSFGAPKPECIFWLKGFCRDGDSCRFAHLPSRKGADPNATTTASYNANYSSTRSTVTPAGPKADTKPLFNVLTVKADLEDIANHQWQLSSYGPGKEDTLLENLDISPEEARTQYYRAYKLAGANGQTASNFETWWTQINGLKSQTIQSALRQIPLVVTEATRRYNLAHQIPDSNPSRRFGPGFNEPAMPAPPSTVGFAGTSGGVQSAFGPGGSGMPVQQQQATFGQPQPSSSFGQPQPASFGQSTSSFGQPAPYQSAFGPGGSGLPVQQQQPAQSTWGSAPATQQPAAPSSTWGSTPAASSSWGSAPAVQSAFGPGGSGPPVQSAFGPGGSGMPVQSAFGPGGSGMPVQQQQQPAQTTWGSQQPAAPSSTWGSTPAASSSWGSAPAVQSAFGPGGSGPAVQSAFGPRGSGMSVQQQRQTQPSFAPPSAFGPGGSGLPTHQRTSSISHPVAAANAFGLPSQPAVGGYTRKKRPLVPGFLNPFPGQPPLPLPSRPSLDPIAGSALPPSLRSKSHRPTMPETQHARERLKKEWAEVPDELRKACEEQWRAEKFEWGRLPGLPPPHAFR